MTLTRKRFATMLSLLLAVCCVLLLTQNTARAADVGYCQELLRGCDQYGNTNTETSFGALAADAARAWSGADVALLPSEDFGTNLAAGPVTEEALANCLQRNSELAVVEMTPAQLYEHLEIGFSHVVVTAQDTIDPEASYFAGYLQMSGLRVVYDAAAPVGERVYQLELENGTPVDPEDHTTRYRVVSTKELLLGAYGYPAFSEEELELVGTELEAVTAYFRSQERVSAPERRVRIYGTRDWVFHHRTIILLALFAVCLVIAQITRRNKRQRDVWHASRTATAEELAADPGPDAAANL